MSIKVMTWVWEHSPHKGSELLTLLALADFAHDDGTGARPSHATLARKIRLSRRQVISLLQMLEKAGAIEILPGKTKTSCNTYTLNLTQKRVTSEKIALVKPASLPSEARSTSTSEVATSHDPLSINHKKTPSESAEAAPPDPFAFPMSAADNRTDHQKGMEILTSVTGPYPDGGAQAKALKWMLSNGATLEQIERELRAQFTDYASRGFRASFLTLQKTIFLPKPGELSEPESQAKGFWSPESMERYSQHIREITGTK